MSGTDGSGDFVAGFFIGALVGAAAALLFAPAPGEEMRKRLREQGSVLKSRAGEMGLDVDRLSGEVRTRGQSFLEAQRARLQEAIEEGRRAAEAKREEMMARLHEAQSTGEYPTPGGEYPTPGMMPIPPRVE